MHPGFEDRLDKKAVLIVGASAGLGRALAVASAREGARVAVAARSEDKLVQLCGELGPESVAVPCDVRRDGDCAAAVQRAVDELGQLDILVYAAGVIPPPTFLAEMTAEDWKWLFETNVIGACLTMAAAVPHLRDRHGRAVFFSSASARWPKVGLVGYSATKVALELLVNSWRNEEPTIAMSTLVIGPVKDTAMTNHWPADAHERFREVWIANGQLTAGGAWMTQEDFAAMALDVMTSNLSVREVLLQPHPWA